MKIAIALAAGILALAFPSATFEFSLAEPAIAGEAPALTFHEPAQASPRFRAFLAGCRQMVESWWAHGGRGAAAGRWHVTAEEKAARQGTGSPHFIVTVAVEQEGLAQLRVLTFEIPPVGQENLFLASHAAYDAILGAILGEFRGSRRWDGSPHWDAGGAGIGPRETAGTGSAPNARRTVLFHSGTVCYYTARYALPSK